MPSDIQLSSLWVYPLHHKGKTFVLQNVGMAWPVLAPWYLSVSLSVPEVTVVRESLNQISKTLSRFLCVSVPVQAVACELAPDIPHTSSQWWHRSHIGTCSCGGWGKPRGPVWEAAAAVSFQGLPQPPSYCQLCLQRRSVEKLKNYF